MEEKEIARGEKETLQPEVFKLHSGVCMWSIEEIKLQVDMKKFTSFQKEKSLHGAEKWEVGPVDYPASCDKP